MLTLIAMPLGFALGWWRAAKRGGQTLDKLQYAVAHMAFFAVVTMLGGLIALPGLLRRSSSA